MPTLQQILQPIVIQGLLAKERLQSGVTFNPLADHYHQDPVATYDRLREKDPVHYSQIARAWVVTHHEDIDAILRDHRRFSNSAGRSRNRTGEGAAAVEEAPSMLFLDQPDHTRLRSLVSQAFTPRAIEGWRRRVEQVADDLIAKVGDAKRFDLMEAMAVPLPITVISDMIGVPEQDRAQFKRWSDDLARTLEPTLTPKEAARAMTSRGELAEYFGRLVDDRHASPREDLVSVLARAEEEGDKLTRQELISTLILLLVAGNETTTNLIGNGALALLQHPDQLRWLRDHLEAIEAAVEEMLRYDSPVQANGRLAMEDFELRGKKIRAGQQLILLQGAGNFDGDTWERPHDLDLSRGDKGHLSFGRGIHHCLGAPLARMEGQVAFLKMLQHWPDMRIAGKPRFKDHVVLRGLRALEVEV